MVGLQTPLAGPPALAECLPHMTTLFSSLADLRLFFIVDSHVLGPHPSSEHRGATLG